jgi:GTP cyclohydrolase I
MGPPLAFIHEDDSAGQAIAETLEDRGVRVVCEGTHICHLYKRLMAYRPKLLIFGPF